MKRLNILLVSILCSSLLSACAFANSMQINTRVQLEAYFSQLSTNTSAKVISSKRRADGMMELYLEGEPYTVANGNTTSTQIFALYKLPVMPLKTAKGKTPAMVLVHGGGGTAFKQWVEKWNDAGFAAMAIAVEGQTDTVVDNLNTTKIKGRLKWQKHLNSGPSRDGIYADFDKPLTEQWMFHAVSAVIRAKNFLASQTDIDEQHIGLAGISWGGVITATVMGFDNGFDFSIPIYGCGFLDSMENQYKEALQGNFAYQSFWEPGLAIDHYLKPSLWLTWRADKHFSLDAQARTYYQLTTDYSVSIKPGIKHGHRVGWQQHEPYLFATQVVRQGSVWAKSLAVKNLNSGKAQAEFIVNLGNQEYQVTKATIHYTKDKGHTGNAKWLKADTELVASEIQPGRYTATSDVLAMEVRHWFVNLEVQLVNENKTYTVSSTLYSN